MNNITEYKKAKIYTEDLGKSLEVINSTIKELKILKKYAPIKECLITLEEQKMFIQIHYEHYKRILDSKGEM
jgi:hypothetical protein